MRPGVRGERREDDGADRGGGARARAPRASGSAARGVRVRAGARDAGGGGAAAVPEHAVRGERLGAVPAGEVRAPPAVAGGVADAVGARPRSRVRHLGGQPAPVRAVVRAAGGGDRRAAGGGARGARRRDELDDTRARRARRQSALLAVGVPDRGRGTLARRSVAQRGGGAGVVRGPRRRGAGASGLRPLRRLRQVGAGGAGAVRAGPVLGAREARFYRRDRRPSAAREVVRALAGTHCGVVSRRRRTGAALGPRLAGRATRRGLRERARTPGGPRCGVVRAGAAGTRRVARRRAAGQAATRSGAPPRGLDGVPARPGRAIGQQRRRARPTRRRDRPQAVVRLAQRDRRGTGRPSLLRVRHARARRPAALSLAGGLPASVRRVGRPAAGGRPRLAALGNGRKQRPPLAPPPRARP